MQRSSRGQVVTDGLSVGYWRPGHQRKRPPSTLPTPYRTCCLPPPLPQGCKRTIMKQQFAHMWGTYIHISDVWGQSLIRATPGSHLQIIRMGEKHPSSCSLLQGLRRCNQVYMWSSPWDIRKITACTSVKLQFNPSQSIQRKWTAIQLQSFPRNAQNTSAQLVWVIYAKQIEQAGKQPSTAG